MARTFVVSAMAAGLALLAGTAAAQSPGGETTPQQNVRQSQQYEQLLCTNPGFRARRVAQECGPLQGSQFYDSCVASFDCNHQPSGAHYRQTPPSLK